MYDWGFSHGEVRVELTARYRAGDESERQQGYGVEENRVVQLCGQHIERKVEVKT